MMDSALRTNEVITPARSEELTPAMSSELLACVDDFEEHAKKKLTKEQVNYFYGGACDGITQRDNKTAFTRYCLVPRVLRGITELNMETTILGHRISFPVGIAPSAFHRVVHPEGELATARAADAKQTVYTMSLLSTTDMKDVAEVSPGCVKFFQLEICRDRAIVQRLVEKAELCGYKAIIVTADIPSIGVRYDILKRPDFLNYISVPNVSQAMQVSEEAWPKIADQRDPSVSWEAIQWLRSITTLPIVIKGILSAADAVMAVENGAAAVWVSNHGGRQLDTATATIDVLASIVEAVAGRCEVFLDGGVRRGTDVLKAIALGARMVFMGMPIISGLAYDGQAGAERVLSILETEFKMAMLLSGCASVSDISPDLLLEARRH